MDETLPKLIRDAQPLACGTHLSVPVVLPDGLRGVARVLAGVVERVG